MHPGAKVPLTEAPLAEVFRQELKIYSDIISLFTYVFIMC